MTGNLVSLVFLCIFFVFEHSNVARLAMDLEKNNALNARQKEEYNKLTNDFNGLQV